MHRKREICSSSTNSSIFNYRTLRYFTYTWKVLPQPLKRLFLQLIAAQRSTAGLRCGLLTYANASVVDLVCPAWQTCLRCCYGLLTIDVAREGQTSRTVTVVPLSCNSNCCPLAVTWQIRWTKFSAAGDPHRLPDDFITVLNFLKYTPLL